MATIDTQKNPATGQGTIKQDWHPADIKAALERAGWSLRRLSETNGYAAGSLKAVLRKRWPDAERVVARTLGTTPETIWPSRYQ